MHTHAREHTRTHVNTRARALPQVFDEQTGRKRRVYVNLRSGRVLLKRPHFLRAYGMEPEREEERVAAVAIQGAVRRFVALCRAARRARHVYEECADADGRPYWFNTRTGASLWARPRWLQPA